MTILSLIPRKIVLRAAREPETVWHMQKFKRFSVIPHLPQELEPLREIAFNLWFSWEPNAVALFEMLDADLWERCYHNPVKLLQRIRQARLREAAEDDGFIRKLGAV